MSKIVMEETHPDFAIRFEQRSGYLYVFVSGARDSLDISTRFWERIYAQAVDSENNRLLVEEDFPNQLSTVELFEIAKRTTAMFGYKCKIAHVDQRGSDMELNRFAETVAANRGLHMRVFGVVEAAEEWLGS